MSFFDTEEELEAFKKAIRERIRALFQQRIPHPPLKPGQDVIDVYLSAQETLDRTRKRN